MMCEHPFIRQTPYPGWNWQDTQNRLSATPLPCGRCLPCRINKKRMWTLRILLEESSHAESIFGTFTYNDDNLPADGFVDPKVLRKFLNRVRYRIRQPWRYFAVGEYGFSGKRAWNPHYHVMFFGISMLQTGLIDQAWNFKKNPIGFTNYGPCDSNTAQYICGYTTAKLTKEGDPYLEGHAPEFMRSSRKNGGIGSKAIERIGQDIKKNPYFEKRIINELKFGNRTYPMGAYLTAKLCEVLEITQEEKDKHLWKYQEGLLSAHWDLTNSYALNILDEKEENRNQQRKRFKIHNSKKRRPI